MANQSQLLWQDFEWKKEVREWIYAQAQRNSIRITGEMEHPHLRVWSTLMRVPTNEGTLFFKATAEETIYESALTKFLADLFPENLPELVAVDISRGWMLMREHGETLRSFVRPSQDIKLWEPVIREYAELQIGLVDHIHRLLALRIPDHRPMVLPQLYQELLTKQDMFLIGQEKGLTPAEYEYLQGLASRFEQICNDLAVCGIPDSLNHGDFHDANVLLKDGRITFFDWGDANITHPFVSLRNMFVSIEMALGLEDYAFTPEMAALLDHYLEPWQKFAPRETLLHAYQLSKPVAAISKALSWAQAIAPLEGSQRTEFAWILPDVLREFLYLEKRLSESS